MLYFVSGDLREVSSEGEKWIEFVDFGPDDLWWVYRV